MGLDRQGNGGIGDAGLDNYPNLKRWFATIDARPAV
jgi:glutathione S-transferase